MALSDSAITDQQKMSGIQAYLRRKYPLEKLNALADAVFTTATEEVTITGTAADGGSANGQVTFPKWLYQQAIEEVIIEKGGGATTARQAMVFPDYRSHVTRT